MAKATANAKAATKAMQDAEKELVDLQTETKNYNDTIDELYARLDITALEEKTEKASRKVRVAVE